MMVWYGFLPGATQFSMVSSMVKLLPRLWKTMPVPGRTVPEPKPQ